MFTHEVRCSAWRTAAGYDSEEEAIGAAVQTAVRHGISAEVWRADRDILCATVSPRGEGLALVSVEASS